MATAMRLSQRSGSWHLLQALFTSSVFEWMGGDYLVSRNFLDGLFTKAGLKGIILGYFHKSPPY
jgi:hypothetical protein